MVIAVRTPAKNDIASQCGYPALHVSSLLGRDPDGGVLSWFGGSAFYPCFNARAAIAKACTLFGHERGSEILVPSYNCGSEVEPLLHHGYKVSLYRVDEDMQIDIDDMEARIGPATRAIYMTHYFGCLQPQSRDVRALCDRHNLRLIEDCALALFSEADGRKAGSYGDIAIFCFSKYFPTDVGGGMVVNDKELRGNLAFARPGPSGAALRTVLRGAARDLIGARSPRPARQDGVDAAGAKTIDVAVQVQDGILPDMPASYYYNPAFEDAAMHWVTRRALLSFSVAETIATRRANFSAYLQLLPEDSSLRHLLPELQVGMVPLAFPVVLSERDTIVRLLNQRGISVSPWWQGYHQGLDWNGFEEAKQLKNSVLALPVHQELDRRHIEYICETLASLRSSRPQHNEKALSHAS